MIYAVLLDVALQRFLAV